MTWIQTASGRKVDLLRPDPEELVIEDIAHALSNICRYTGHTGSFYSVAQHSVLASYHVSDAKFALAALMHDATEAYLGDVSKPLKDILGQKYATMENRFGRILAQKFRYEYPYPVEVRVIDQDLLETEFNTVMGGKSFEHSLGTMRLEIVMLPWEPHIAEQKFLARYDELSGQLDFDFGPALAKALVGREEAMAKPLFYKCRECGRQHKVGGKPRHGTRRGTKKRQADDSRRGTSLPRGKGGKTVRRRRGKGTR